MAFVYNNVCRRLLPLRSSSWSKATAQRLCTVSAVDQNTNVVKKKEGEGVVEYVTPDELVHADTCGPFVTVYLVQLLRKHS